MIFQEYRKNLPLLFSEKNSLNVEIITPHEVSYKNIRKNLSKYPSRTLIFEKLVTDKGTIFSYDGVIDAISTIENILVEHENDEYGFKFKILNLEKKSVENYSLISTSIQKEVYFDINDVEIKLDEIDRKVFITISSIDEEKFQRFQKIVIEVLKYGLDTRIIYKKSLFNKVVEDFKKELQISHQNMIPFNFLSYARNLKFEDCVYGGLIGGKYRYTITHKASGVRKILYFHESGIWYISPPRYLNCLISIAQLSPTGQEAILKMKGSILDGENIENIEGIENTLLVFDVLKIVNNDIRNLPHNIRMDYAKKLNNTFSTILKIENKEFIPIENNDTDLVENLSNIFDRLLAEVSSLKYPTDGFMFTPIECAYFHPKTELPEKERVLSKNPDICKLKPWNEMTLDFLYGGDKTLFIAKEISTNPNVRAKHTLNQPYKGTFYYPFDSNMNVLWDKGYFDNIEPGSIVELGPVSNEGGVIKMDLRRIRYDKITPNRSMVANSAWNNINDPLTIDALCFRDFRLVFKYHNTEKKILLDKILPDCDIIDIGSGDGNNLGKMKNAHHILCIEPNKTHLDELIRKSQIEIAGVKMEEKITTLLCGGEDTDTIMEKIKTTFDWENSKRDLYITMFLSLSFFFDEKFEGLIRTINSIVKYYQSMVGKTVHFIATTIEEKRTLSVIKKYGDNFNLGPVNIKFTPPNTLYINIPNTIVVNQTEYLVDLDRLQSSTGMKKVTIKTQNDENFLSKEAKDYSSMFVSFTSSFPVKIFQKINDKMSYVKIEEGNILYLLSSIYKISYVDMINYFVNILKNMGYNNTDFFNTLYQNVEYPIETYENLFIVLNIRVNVYDPIFNPLWSNNINDDKAKQIIFLFENNKYTLIGILDNETHSVIKYY